MNKISCAKCGRLLEKENEACPNCGSVERNFLVSLLDVAEIRDNFSMSIINRHKIWTYIPKTIQYNLKNLSGDTSDVPIHGLCLEIIISTASLVEGIITDHIIDELESCLHDPSKKKKNQGFLKGIHNKTWRGKKEILEYLEWDVQALQNHNLMENLFRLRNNIAHGKGYSVVDTRGMRNKILVRTSPLSIENDNYFIVYKFLVEKRVVPDLDDNTSVYVEYFLSPNVARYFYEGAVTFINAFFASVQLSSNVNMQPEFDRACSN